MADVTVVNNGDQAVAYLGFACWDPATVLVRSTRPAPTGPIYSASATALRGLVMTDRHSRDAVLATFTDKTAKAAGCDESAIPTLPPHLRMAYRLTNTFAIDGVAEYDASTTDVVTTLKLGVMPDPGRPPAPIQPADTIEVRTPLQQVSSLTVASKAISKSPGSASTWR